MSSLIEIPESIAEIDAILAEMEVNKQRLLEQRKILEIRFKDPKPSILKMKFMDFLEDLTYDDWENPYTKAKFHEILLGIIANKGTTNINAVNTLTYTYQFAYIFGCKPYEYVKIMLYANKVFELGMGLYKLDTKYSNKCRSLLDLANARV